MSFLVTPPQRTITVMMEGSLRCTFPRSLCLYKSAEGVWTATEGPSLDVLDAAETRLPGGDDRPQTVDDDLGSEIAAALPALNATLPDGVAAATCVAI